LRQRNGPIARAKTVIICLFDSYLPTGLILVGAGILAAALSPLALVFAACAGVRGALGVTLPVGNFSPAIIYSFKVLLV
jgi:hypothetical protein